MSALTGKDVMGLEWEFTAHLKLGSGGYRWDYRCVAYPDLTFTVTGERGHPVERRLYLGDEELTWGDWDGAAARLNELNDGREAAA